MTTPTIASLQPPDIGLTVADTDPLLVALDRAGVVLGGPARRSLRGSPMSAARTAAPVSEQLDAWIKEARAVA